MRFVDLIIKKRDNGEMTTEELQFFVDGFTDGEIPDYQAAAWAMAVLLNGMTPQETTDLTLAMANSGDTLDLSAVVDIAVDKHSTGGVGDKVSLVVGPVVAACGLPVGKMSGRGLGFSGGTLDKMEAIPGYRTDLSTEEFLGQLKEVGFVLTGQTGDLAPADGLLYALRDVTGTVPSLPLIASSIMSKKIAAGAQKIVLDVKTGVGAFMKTVDEAKELAKMMVQIAELAGREAVAVISDMNQPLGNAVGNALEVAEAVDALHGGGPADLREHSVEVAGYMLLLGKKVGDIGAGREMAADALDKGLAWEKFRQLVSAQGGDAAYIDDPGKLPKARLVEIVRMPKDAYIAGINARIVGETGVMLGGGRYEKGDPIDPAVGMEVLQKVGTFVKEGEKLYTIHANDEGKLAEALKALDEAVTFSDEPVEPLPCFYEVVK